MSQTAYEHLDAEQTRKLARAAFPSLIDQPAGGPPQLAAGERILRYVADNAAPLALPGSKHGVLESLEPIARETSRGHYAPIDLRLRRAGSGFQPTSPAVAVEIPKRLSRGIKLTLPGVSLTPIDAGGSALGGAEGTVQGASVMYANTLTDTDTLVKPTTVGFASDTLLRSAFSPERLLFRVGMPTGARLVVAKDGWAAVDVVAEGATIATVRPVAARDAEGTPVPVSMSLSGDVLSVTVAHFAGRYRLPIAVDPEVRDVQWSGSASGPTEWHFEHEGSAFTAPQHPEGGAWTETISGNHSATEWGAFEYTTRGESQITRADVEGTWNDTGAGVQNLLQLLASGPPAHVESEHETMPVTSEMNHDWFVCAPEKNCPEVIAKGAPENHNTATYRQQATQPGKGVGGSNTLGGGSVYIKQEQSPEVKFNTTSPTIYNKNTHENISNVLYGGGSWLGPHSGAYEVNAKDPGIGISYYFVNGEGAPKDFRYYYATHRECFGVQCPTEVNQGYLYESGMPDGEKGIQAFAEDAAGLWASVIPGDPKHPSPTFKIDATPPRAIKLNGLQNGNELPLGEAHLKVEATDGEAYTPSSGVKSIKVSVDGKEVAGSPASCPLGPCTASTELALASRNYAAGQHSVIVTAIDNANNVAQEEFTFKVHGASPVSVGPGSIDPSTGELTLSGSDVSMGGGIGISRTYQSRHLSAGSEGPLGPQWAINLGGDESLAVLVNGSAVLTASGGARTTFTLAKNGEFESPPGDGNLKLEAKEKEAGKGISAYVLSDKTSASKTTFEQPGGAQSTTPTFANQFGTQARLNHPLSDALDSSGNVWVTDSNNNLIEQFSAAGTLLKSYGSFGTQGGQFSSPWGIAVDLRNGNVYVSDQANSRIEELSSSGTFLKAFGWGVADGKGEFEICTEAKKCQAGIPGSENGQLNLAAGVAVDSNGNVWVADYANNRLEEFNEKGGYVQKFGSAGKGAEQLEGPLTIALSGGNLYVTDSRNNRIQEFSPSGAPLGRFGEGGSESGKFASPYGIAADPVSGNLYVADSGNARVQEFTPAGTFITKFGSRGTEPGQLSTPTGVAVSKAGGVYVVDDGANQLQEWTRSTWVPTEVGGPLSAKTTYAYKSVEQEGTAVIEPSEVLAPAPIGVECTPELQRGCRALTFNYAEKTTAEGEKWGDYKGHLTRVYFTGWDPSKGAMSKPITVAQYAYDASGRLRAEWDPRIEASTACGGPCLALKTIYGYDAEGHVTALSAPGQQPWLLTYGAVPGDVRSGDLLAVTRPSANTSSGPESAPVNTAAPSLSTTTAVEGTQLTVSNGGWSNSPLAYGYQWERCFGSSSSCQPILGASNQSYAPIISDRGRTLRVTITATNARGSTTQASNTTGATASMGYYEHKLEFGGGGQLTKPSGVAVDPQGNVWVADTGNNRIAEFSASGALLHSYGKTGVGSGEFKEPKGIAVDPHGNVLVADTGNSRIQEFSSSGQFEQQVATPAAPAGITVGPPNGEEKLNAVYVTLPARNEVIGYYQLLSEGRPVAGFEKMGSYGGAGSGNGQFNAPSGVAIAELGSELYVVDSGNHRVQVLSTGFTYNPPWPPPSVNFKYLSQFGSAGSGSGQFAEASGIALECPGTSCPGPQGNPYLEALQEDTLVADPGNGRVQQFEGLHVAQQSYHEAGAQAVAINTYTEKEAGYMYVANSQTSAISKWVPAAVPAVPSPPPNPGTSAVTTIEYHVPVSGAGAGAPTLTEGEVAKWGQKDYPVEGEGVAIFPPDEPQAWPATSYKRATIHYWDAYGRLVNTALPTGGIATSEYNATNDVVRTLSADNRATALKEGAGSTENSAKISESLDTKSAYSPDGTQLRETRGPQHKVKLAQGGAEPLARNHVKYFYNEGSPSGETGESYSLVTKTTDGAEYEGKEADVRTTTTSYSGQNNLGWELRKPTSVTTDPGGLNLTKTTVYDKNTGNPVESTSPAGSSFSFSFTHPIETQWGEPNAVATDPSGNIWVADASNNRMLEFNAERQYVRQFGEEGTGPGQFKGIGGIATDAEGNLYVSDSENDRVQEFSPSGTYIETFGSGAAGEGQLVSPGAIALDPSGNVWVLNSRGGPEGGRVVEFSASKPRKVTGHFGSSGSGPGQLGWAFGLAISEGHLYVADATNHRVQQFSTSGEAVGAPFDVLAAGVLTIAADPTTHNLYVAEAGNNRVQQFSPAGIPITSFGSPGSGNGQLSSPRGVAVNSSGGVYVADTGNKRVEEWIPAKAPEPPTYRTSFTHSIEVSWGELNAVATDPSGNIWVADSSNDRILEFNAERQYMRQFGEEGTGPGQFKGIGGLATDAEGNLYVSDTENDRVQEFSPSGTYIEAFGSGAAGEGQLVSPGAIALDPSGNVWVLNSQGGPEKGRIVEFSASKPRKVIGHFGSSGSGPGQLGWAFGLAISEGHLYVADSTNHRVQAFTTSGATVGASFDEKAAGVLTIAADPTTHNLYVAEAGNNRVQQFTSSGSLVSPFGSSGSGPGQLSGPRGVAVSPSGQVYVGDSGNNRVDAYALGSGGPRTTQTIYYSVGANEQHPECGGHPEWADLPCLTKPAAQPGTPGLPNLPETTASYNLWSEPETATETFGSTKRIKAQTYDLAGRAVTSEVSCVEGPKSSPCSSSIEKPLPTVANAYNEATGALEKQSTASEGKTKTITSVYNALGQLEKYTDADGVTSTYKYDSDGRVEEVNHGTVQGETASQIYTYDPTSGLLTKLNDTGARAIFTAAYDVEGRMTSENYPYGLKASYTRNQLGEASGVEYEQTTNCSSNCKWFSDAIVPSIHGEALKQVSTLSEEPSYIYDAAGRLKQVQEKVGKGCTTRVYAYDEDGNRTSLTTRPPGAKEGECTSTGGGVEAHTYDAAARLTDTGVSYDPLGNTTTLPAADAAGHELKSSYYVDSQVAGQEQEGKTISYSYDPAGRREASLASGKETIVSHYAGPGEALTWTTEGSTKWTRNIPGIDGTLCATQSSGQAPVFQLHDLQGNIVATAELSETNAKLASTYNSTEFGVPQPGTAAPKYAWLGASGLSSELPSSGVVTTGASSYVPEIGRALQTGPVASPGAFPDGTGGAGIVQVANPAAWNELEKAIALEHEAALEAAAWREAEAEAERARWHECASCVFHGEGNLPAPTEGGAGGSPTLEELAPQEGEGATIATSPSLKKLAHLGPCVIKDLGITQNNIGVTFFKTTVACATFALIEVQHFIFGEASEVGVGSTSLTSPTTTIYTRIWHPTTLVVPFAELGISILYYSWVHRGWRDVEETFLVFPPK